MSAISVHEIQAAELFSSHLGGTPVRGESLHAALIRRLQSAARGVRREQRAALHRAFASEWRLFRDCEFQDLRSGKAGVPGETYPLLNSLYRGAEIGETVTPNTGFPNTKTPNTGFPNTKTPNTGGSAAAGNLLARTA